MQNALNKMIDPIGTAIKHELRKPFGPIRDFVESAYATAGHLQEISSNIDTLLNSPSEHMIGVAKQNEGGIESPMARRDAYGQQTGETPREMYEVPKYRTYLDRARAESPALDASIAKRDAFFKKHNIKIGGFKAPTPSLELYKQCKTLAIAKRDMCVKKIDETPRKSAVELRQTKFESDPSSRMRGDKHKVIPKKPSSAMTSTSDRSMTRLESATARKDEWLQKKEDPAKRSEHLIPMNLSCPQFIN